MSTLIKQIEVIRRGPVPGVMRRELNNHSKTAWTGCGFVWGETMRPGHFTESAKLKYQYKPRSGRYESRKLKVKGHRRPGVWSGLTEALTGQYRVTSSFRGAKVTMRAGALNFSKRQDELTTVVKSEADEIAKVWKEKYLREVEALRTERSQETIT